MATTTTSNRKKPSTSAKAAKVTKKVITKPNSKTVKKPVKAVKATAKKSASATRKAPAAVSAKPAKRVYSPFDRLRSFNLSTGVLYLILAGLVCGFTETIARAVNLGISARDDFASNSGVVLGQSYETVYNVEPKFVLAGALGVSGVAALLLATRLRNKYQDSLVNRISGFRWMAVGLSSALLMAFVLLLAGINDLSVLKLSSALILVASLLGWVSEQQNVKAARPSYLAFVIALFAGAMAWLPVVGTLIGTTVFSEERFAWFVYAIAGVTLLGFVLFAVTLYRSIRPAGQQKDYAVVEEAYLRVDLLTKFAVVLIALLALK